MKKQPVFSNDVRVYRKKSGLTQDELAYLVGERFGSQMFQVENAARYPSFRTSVAFEIVFRTRLLKLFADTYAMTDLGVKKRAARLLTNLERRPFAGRNRQKIEFLGEIVRAPDLTPNNR